MKFFKTLISLHTVKLIIIAIIAIIYLATTPTNNSKKIEVTQRSGSITNEDIIINEGTKTLSVAKVDFMTIAAQVDYGITTGLNKK